MDNDQINYIRHRLQRYEESITETEVHFEHLESFGCYRACAPYIEKFGIPLLIDMLQIDTRISDTFWQEYDRITEKLNAFGIMKGQAYRDMLYTDLQNYVKSYHAALCYMNLNMIAITPNHDLVNRDAVRALISELRRDYDIGDIEKLVIALDKSFLNMNEPVNGYPAEIPPIVSGGGYLPHTACDKYHCPCRDKEQTRFI
jgi:hypothetical protein